VVAGTQEGVLMVESESDGLNEEVMLGRRSCFGHAEMQVAINAYPFGATQEPFRFTASAAVVDGLDRHLHLGRDRNMTRRA